MSSNNIILFHLESVNQTLLGNRADLFENIYRFMPHCTVYTKYYSTATSTIMVMLDLFFGDRRKFEYSKGLADLKNDDISNSLFTKLSLEGYKTSAITFPILDAPNDEKNIKMMIGENSQLLMTNEYNQFLENIELEVNRTEKFAIWIYDASSLLSYVDRSFNSESSWFNKKEKGYRNVDRTFGRVLEFLQKSEKLDNTSIVLFGDHGDDCWTHALHDGYCHAIEPYSSLVHTPLIIFNPYQDKCILNKHLCSTEWLNSFLQGKKEKQPEYVFSRNLFANQNLSAEMLNKGYAVTNGKYRLIVTRNGLELYNEMMDPLNGCNLLDFYYLKTNKKIEFSKHLYLIDNEHIKCMLFKQLDEIEQNFYCLREKLNQDLQNMGKYGDISAIQMGLNRIKYVNNYRKYRISWNNIKRIIKNKVKRVIRRT